MSNDPKLNAAIAALDFIEDGMIVGLGTGSTSAHFVRQLGERVKQGLKVKGVPTSEATRNLAEQHGVPLLGISQVTAIDVDVDGADEVDPQFRLIKGGGGALLREKIVAAASKQMVVIADSSKWVETLGAFPLPVEVTRFGFSLTQARIQDALRATGCSGDEVALRIAGKSNEPVITDGGNYILDAHALRIPDADALGAALKSIAGVVEHGLFLGLAQTVIIGTSEGANVKRL
ncbi:ribose-5-phosphate isomerase RpiA [Terricaulis sp.]|uniref:ribose-5-phosphate isomerase RpiA n=1 Tax=Terricaulis sp. TaxID=2768686 RepID=UPI002AC75755|nr:ribose-5-phosphate isomerase RpiA [Terricaulis sp.]MDZ4689865.1 ribose-5-phosphate isomerase RpiA [Terricaulis sp.]